MTRTTRSRWNDDDDIYFEPSPKKKKEKKKKPVVMAKKPAKPAADEADEESVVFMSVKQKPAKKSAKPMAKLAPLDSRVGARGVDPQYFDRRRAKEKNIS
jgi:hypothetical protein